MRKIFLLAVLCLGVGGCGTIGGDVTEYEQKIKELEKQLEETGNGNEDSSDYTHKNNLEEGDRESQKIKESVTIAGMSPIELFEGFEGDDSIPFGISERAHSFISQHPELFKKQSEGYKSFLDESIEFKQIEKNVDKYGDQVISVEASVIDILETEIEEGTYITQMQVMDTNLNSYYIFYPYEIEDVYTDSEVLIYGVPLSTTSFENVGGGYTRAIVLAGIKVISNTYNTEKIQIVPDKYDTNSFDPFSIAIESYPEFVGWSNGVRGRDVREDRPCTIFTATSYELQALYTVYVLDNGECYAHYAMDINEWMFYDSDTRYLMDYELMYLTEGELRVARNEIYARHGRMFQSDDLQSYFNSMTWYYPTIPANQFSEELLNEIEKANVEKIKEFEQYYK